MTWHYNWTNQSNSLSWSEKYENSEEIWDLFINTYGWTEEATAAVISNFQHEGLLNPAQWQIGSTIGTWESNTVGLGLGQWTPASKIGDYCGGRDQSHVEDGAKQIQCVIDDPYGQWVQRVNSSGYSRYYGVGGIPYITSISNFAQSTLDPEDLATCWCACWEGPSKTGFENSYNARREDARYWYEEFRSGVIGHAVLININGNGSAQAVPARAIAGTRITITAIPNDSDTFIEWDVIQGNISINPTLNPQSFTMPLENVVLRANFTGATPLPTFHKESHRMPIWMYPCLK